MNEVPLGLWHFQAGTFWPGKAHIEKMRQVHHLSIPVGQGPTSPSPLVQSRGPEARMANAARERLEARTAHHPRFETHTESRAKTTSVKWNLHLHWSRNASICWRTIELRPASCTHSRMITKLRSMYPALRVAANVLGRWSLAPRLMPPMLKGWQPKSGHQNGWARVQTIHFFDSGTGIDITTNDRDTRMHKFEGFGHRFGPFDCNNGFHASSCKAIYTDSHASTKLYHLGELTTAASFVKQNLIRLVSEEAKQWSSLQQCSIENRHWRTFSRDDNTSKQHGTLTTWLETHKDGILLSRNDVGHQVHLRSNQDTWVVSEVQSITWATPNIHGYETQRAHKPIKYWPARLPQLAGSWSQSQNKMFETTNQLTWDLIGNLWVCFLIGNLWVCFLLLSRNY